MLDKSTLEQIIQRCIKGERKAQKALFEAFASHLYAVSRRYSPISVDPMDNLQDSFIKIFDKLHQYDPERGAFSTWAGRIVINNALAIMNKNQLKVLSIEHGSSLNSMDEKALSKMSMEELHIIIEQLPDGYKQVFCLYEIEGYSHAEIAEMLHIKEASSRSQLTRAKKLLQELLTGLNPEFSKVYKTN
jgi:RNA polymerase sigma factor (sigma-70 family)